jgi:hypothetical protein
MMRRVEPLALLTAAVLHAGVLAFAWLSPKAELPPAPRLDDMALFEVEAVVAPLDSPSSPAEAVQAPSGGSARAPSATSASVPILTASPAPTAPAPDAGVPVSPSETSTEAPLTAAIESPGAQPRKIDLGIFGSELGRALSTPEPGARPDAAGQGRPSTQARLDAALLEQNRPDYRSLAAPFISPARGLAHDLGPQTGQAVFRVLVGPTGRIERVQQASEGGGWGPVLAALDAALRKLTLKLPPGAKGLLVELQIDNRIQLPSGRAAGAPAVGVDTPNLKPGGLALRGGGFDVADIGASARAISQVRILKETVIGK